MSFESNWENCKNCQYCNTENGQSDWYCEITDEQYENEDSIPCKGQEDKGGSR